MRYIRSAVLFVGTLLLYWYPIASIGKRVVEDGTLDPTADASAVEDSLEKSVSLCETDASCDLCVANPQCGMCTRSLISGDGTASVILSECREGGASGPTDTSQTCDSWNYLSCTESCPNECSGHGVCQDDGSCLCSLSYEGEDCGTEKEVHNKAEIIIPIAFLCALFVVSLLVFEQVRDQRCVREGNRSDDEEPELEDAAWESAAVDDQNASATTSLLRSRPARG